MKQKEIFIKKKVVVAMSGGVDSSVAAALLKSQGYDVIGVFMQFWFPAGETYGENRCCSLESWREAQEVARIIGIPIHKVNFGKQFKKAIVDEFLSEYRAGRTPNPCVACNKFIKFDLLLKYAQTVFGADFLATGHYVSLVSLPRRRESKFFYCHLLKAKDSNKDQTYFLYNLKQEQLKHLLFPLGDFNKEEIRKKAKALKLPIHDKKDSQEICFVGRSHYDFLKKYLKLKLGEIFDADDLSGKGKAIGKHQGLPLYTIGQRSGIGLSGGPWYVCALDQKKNRLYVTKDQESAMLYDRELVATAANWINPVEFPFKCQAQIRYRGKPSACVVSKKGKHLDVKFKTPQRAVMSGQSIVFYDKKELLGGGIIV